jgi:hypothetical protein
MALLGRQRGSLASDLLNYSPGLSGGAIEFELFYHHCQAVWPYVTGVLVSAVVYLLLRAARRSAMPRAGSTGEDDVPLASDSN